MTLAPGQNRSGYFFKNADSWPHLRILIQSGAEAQKSVGHQMPSGDSDTSNHVTSQNQQFRSTPEPLEHYRNIIFWTSGSEWFGWPPVNCVPILLRLLDKLDIYASSLLAFLFSFTFPFSLLIFLFFSFFPFFKKLFLIYCPCFSHGTMCAFLK